MILLDKIRRLTRCFALSPKQLNGFFAPTLLAEIGTEAERKNK